MQYFVADSGEQIKFKYIYVNLCMHAYWFVFPLN